MNPQNKGMLFDTRDGQSYPIVKIGNQIWTAENFRYLPSKDKGDLYDTSYAFDNNNDYLEKGYGRLYDWDTANHIATEGWRLPNNKDFKELRVFITKDNNLPKNSNKVGNYLKSVEGWDKPCDGIVNLDKYGFNAKPAGRVNSKPDNFTLVGGITFLWSYNYPNSWVLCCIDGDLFCNLNNYSINNRVDGFSVRLIKSQ